MTIQNPPLWTNKATTEWVDSMIDDFIVKYKSTSLPQRVNFRVLCSQWPWAKRSNVYTHFFHRYPAKLLPYIPIFFLSSSLIGDDQSVLDPFAGTGTVGLECMINFIHPRDCLLIEISPLARLISSAKTTLINPVLLRKRFEELSILIGKYDKDLKIPQFPRIDFWFRRPAQVGLAKIRTCINNLDIEMTVKDFFWACFSSIIRDMSRADPKIAPPVLLSIDKYPESQRMKILSKLNQKQSFDAGDLFEKAVMRNIARMQQLWIVFSRTENPKTTRVIGDDVRNMTHSPYIGKGRLNTVESKPLADCSVGMVITSPPYINAQKYARTTKFELWWLELIDESAQSLAELDKNLIGTERIGYQEYVQLKLTGNLTADGFLKWLFDIEPRKAGIISKYFNNMRLALREIVRVLCPGGYCILVVGNNAVFKRVIPSNQILAEIAQEEGLELKTMLVDEIRSRGMITKRHETASMIPDEWIILLQKPTLRV